MLLEKENMTAKQYKYVLQQLFILFYKRIRRKYKNKVVMQDDNALQHIAKIITKYLKNKRVRQMNQPPQSPDLNLIKNLWKYIKDIISKRKHQIRNIRNMRLALQIAWPQVDTGFLLKLCDSVLQRWEACLKNKGGATKY